MPSASSLDRADHCPPSHYLPVTRGAAAVYALRGTGVHDFIVRWRDHFGKDRDAALAEVPDDAPHRALCEALPLDAIPDGGKLEVAFAYDPSTDTARILGYNIGRAYKEHGAQPHEVCGTADLVGTADGTVIVIDWKSGFGFVPKWQLRFLALAACRALGLSRAKVCNWFLREDGTIREDKDSVDEFDAFDLDQIAAEVRATLSRLRISYELDADHPSVTGGAWCQYCDCKPHCDLQTGLAKRALGMDLSEAFTPERAMEAALIASMVKEWAESVEAGLREYAKTTPFPDGKGNIVKEVERSTTKIVAAKAQPVLRQVFGDAVADAARESKVTQASIERALKANRKGPLAPAKRQAMEALRRAGAAFESTHREVRPVRDAAAPMAALQLDADGGFRPLLLSSGSV
jgi:hypothetical protein